MTEVLKLPGVVKVPSGNLVQRWRSGRTPCPSQASQTWGPKGTPMGSTAKAMAAAATDEDPHLWLEDVSAEKCLEWAKETWIMVFRCV